MPGGSPMSKFKRVPIEKLGEYLEGDRRIAVEKDGKIVGFYYPRAYEKPPVRSKDLDGSTVKPESRAEVDQLQATLQAIYKRTGMTEDEFADLMDPRIEFPYDRSGGELDRETGG